MEGVQCKMYKQIKKTWGTDKGENTERFTDLTLIKQSPKIRTVTILDAVLTVNIESSWEGRQLFIFNSFAFKSMFRNKFGTCLPDLLDHKAT